MINQIVLLFVTWVEAASALGLTRSSTVRPSSFLCMSSALIVQNKGGGHGELGKLVDYSIQK